MTCPSCGTENREDRRFCTACGASLSAACPSCGAATDPGDRFCGQCGAPLAPGPPAAAPPSPGRREPATERRLVSILFADLVGFTSASEGRDAEETRELLSRYFDTGRKVIERYGGAVEKFIGDAVMAVWGTPTANEDDAERAVRAALDLVASIPLLDPTLHARAGVLTGEAAVALGAEGEGMVAGDLVNTASRIQSAAEPGTVLVGESTQRATETAIAYQPAGTFELKGKAEQVPLYRALRVTAARGGALKSEGLEPPFVGRERELRLIKELFHASAEERKAHVVSVVGIAGIGKSRLSWEFEKYVDGLVGPTWFWRGRCLAYGEGVAYWALAEMVRRHAGILEGEDPSSAREKLSLALKPSIADAQERAWIEPRLAQLLGLEERQVHERDDLFAAWRLYFERLSEQRSVVLVFEDMQWADVSMLAFVDYLLEWSRNHAIFVLVLARPELAERHPTFGAGTRNMTLLSLEPLSASAMEELLSGFVPGLPGELHGQILERAEGVPLYAVETVRMLLDRGLLEREEDVYRPTGPIEALDVPETLHALVAARLDGLEQEERRLVQDASVLGKTFTKPGLSALSGLGEADVEPLLTSLVRKEILTVQADPRSPERGQYVFLQDLLKRVAYETLARRERKGRHLAAAAYLESIGFGEHEAVEVVASHYLDAYRAAPDDDDAPAIKEKAREMLARAGERAASLAATDEAQRYFEQAAELAEDGANQAQLHERAGEMAWMGGRHEQAQVHFERALQLLEAEGKTHPGARVSARLGEVEWRLGRLDEAVERTERAFAELSADEPDADVAVLTAQLGRFHFFAGNLDRASELLEQALTMAEVLALPEVLVSVMNTYGVIASWRSRLETAEALFAHSLKLALEHELPTPACRAYNNLADIHCRRDRYEEALPLHEAGLALTRRWGIREWESTLAMESCQPLLRMGRWDEALERAAEMPESVLASAIWPAGHVSEIHVNRGDVAAARRLVDAVRGWETAGDVQQRAVLAAHRSIVEAAEGDHERALEAGVEAMEALIVLSPSHEAVKTGFVQAVESALALGRREKAEEYVARVEALRPGELPPFLRAQARRLRGRLAAAQGEHDRAEPAFRAAAGVFREYGLPFWLAVTLLEHGELTRDRVLLDEAREIFERLGAKPWLERVASVAPARVSA